MTLEKEFECYAAISEIEQIYGELQDLMGVDYLKAINGVSGAINTLKSLADLAVKSHSVELKEGLLNLREEMLQLKEALIDAKEENLELKQRVAGLEAKSKEELILKDGLYYKEKGEGPFCPNCYEGKQVVSRLGGVHLGAGKGSFNCSQCKWQETKV